MPLRYVRKKLTANNALTLAVATASVSHELTDLLSFPPARAATGILLLIFKTIQDIQTNQTECYRLARRCLSLLMDLRDAMDGKWETAPDSLLKNIQKFERTLQDINDGLQRNARGKWHNRLMNKNNIETDLNQFNSQVDDAARSFQIATLIHLHHATGSSHEKPKSATLPSIAAPPYVEKEICQSPVSIHDGSSSDFEVISLNSERTSTSEKFIVISEMSPSSGGSFSVDTSIVEKPLSEQEILKQEIEDLEDHGFRRYHRSDVILKGRSRIQTGWWAGAREAQVEGRQLLIISYEQRNGQNIKKWLRDVKILQNVFNPNLPQMIGYSGTDVPTPFILLANVQTRLPQALVQDTIKNASLLECATLLVRLYQDLFDAAVYLQRQLNLSESKIQDYVEHASFRIEGEGTMVMGLPPAEVDLIQSWRNFGLAYSIQDVFLKLLPRRGIYRRPYDPTEEGDSDSQQKIAHLGALARSLLPSSDSLEVASSRLSSLLSLSESEEPHARPLSLASMRDCAIDADTHRFTWSNNFVPAHLFRVGDVGYIPPNSDFSGFVRICNVLDEWSEAGEACQFKIQPACRGWQSPRAGPGSPTDLQSFEAPGDVTGWPVVLQPGDRYLVQLVHERSVTNTSVAWRVLLHRARDLAKKHDVKPEDIMLVTRAGTDQRFYVSDNRNPPFPGGGFSGHHARGGMHSHQSHGMPAHQHHGMFGQRGHGMHNHHAMHHFPPDPPAIYYLFTSGDAAHAAYFSDSPVHIPLPHGAARPEVRGKCSFGIEGTYGFMNYVQLHAEDFA